MNDDVMGGKWKQVKGSVKSAFGRLTDDDVTQIEGNQEKAVGILQERYGYSKADAQRAWDDFVHGTSHSSAEHDMNRAKDEASDAADDAKRGLRRSLD